MLGRLLLSTGEAVAPGSIISFDMEFIIRLLIQWFNILLIVFVLAHFLYKPVKKFMSDRTERIRDDIDSARLNNEKAMQTKADYQNMVDNIDKEREHILGEAHRAAVKRSDQILFDTQEEAKYMIAKAHDEIKIERENAADEIKIQIIEISNLVASRFIEVSVDQQIQNKYIDEALAEWSEQV